ncbi:UDP-N-acetylenolpyruvoylglucosamine reductase [Exophiala aquamarina CBS 119918]|uniref:UDP-N-acetylmuramate dehydrogenase n=1 Tax=Exophiala aquamarina CBS 119918 TaxID=1182545 RepID=A0A072P6U2_9EURO|nr:UDP-N-acetylenolpyruvoylglucosamine reductase [Exophiala aquamarina CBS 119918]KEF55814.1 UDP-N-acetylenolpyruvoylglucosamine reductase [Exophiala aquamarina CBS 119918]
MAGTLISRNRNAVRPYFRRLDNFNTFGLRSCASDYIVISALDLLDELSGIATAYSHIWIIGDGSNIILPARVHGLVIQPTIRGVHTKIESDDEVIVTVCSGEKWHDFVVWCVEHQLGGLENLAMIPGTVGASPVQNIGAYGAEVSDCIEAVFVWDLKGKRMIRFPSSECMFGYRTSRFSSSSEMWHLIVGVVYKLKRKGWRPNLNHPELMNDSYLSQNDTQELTPKEVFRAVCDIRQQKFAGIHHCAGSFFKNPVVSRERFRQLQALHPGIVSQSLSQGQRKLAAAWLIEQCGWKGYNTTRVGIHKNQALIIVNHGEATSEDLLELASTVRKSIYNRYSIFLQIEPVYFVETFHLR